MKYDEYMKKLGEGWQYTAYDLGDGRVLKKFHSLPRMYWVILKDISPFNSDPLPFYKLPSFARASKRKALESFEILKHKNIPASWLGNPKRLKGLDYEQDKIKPLHDVFEENNTEVIKSIIDQFIIFNRELLELGVIDKSFNVTKNYGLSKKGEMVMIDFGELLADPVRINKRCQVRAWSEHYVAGCIKDQEAQEYFIKKMDENFGTKA